MDKILFEVQGSAKEPYRVTFWKNGEDFKSGCNCRAGKNGMYCKHRLDLLEGDLTNLKSTNYEDLEKVYEMLEGSDLGKILDEFLYLREAEIIYKKYSKMIFKTTSFEKNEIPFYTQEDILLEKITIIKKGVNCYFFDFNFNFLGWNKANLLKIKKLYPDLHLEESVQGKNILISERTNIDKANIYFSKKDYIKELRERVKLAIR